MTTTMRDALATYFRDNGFGDDGGYGDAWVDFELGPLPMPFPNTSGRKWAVRFHDLHHILTGYRTNTVGELEISAWEIGAGCPNAKTAFVINLSGLASGMFFAHSRTFAAFRRGLRSRTLYAEDYERTLGEDVEAVRARHVGEPSSPATLGERARFVALGLAGTIIGLTFFALCLPLLPLGLVNVFRKRARMAREANGTA